jgi:hypothetical protein
MASSSKHTTKEDLRVYRSRSSFRPVITSSTTDEVPENNPFICNSSSVPVSSVGSIPSYKTEKAVNSRKSRYNALPRRKYADIGHSTIPQAIMSGGVGDDPVPKVRRAIGRLDIHSCINVTFRPTCVMSHSSPPREGAARPVRSHSGEPDPCLG